MEQNSWYIQFLLIKTLPSLQLYLTWGLGDVGGALTWGMLSVADEQPPY